ncbi:keratinocyte proline-rich protein [Anabrus simplex]|uniref:keratinocyte proline-rich protein n=1 Tax=Anabrus simplex TaxID=316456 RepID=UPI0034DCDE42
MHLVALIVISCLACSALAYRTCSTTPCVSTDYRSYTQCLSKQCGPVCPIQNCPYANCNACNYNQFAPCCQSCCARRMPQPALCQPVQYWPFVQCGGCKGGGCSMPMLQPQPQPMPPPMPQPMPAPMPQPMPPPMPQPMPAPMPQPMPAPMPQPMPCYGQTCYQQQPIMPCYGGSCYKPFPSGCGTGGCK